MEKVNQLIEIFKDVGFKVRDDYSTFNGQVITMSRGFMAMEELVEVSTRLTWFRFTFDHVRLEESKGEWILEIKCLGEHDNFTRIKLNDIVKIDVNEWDLYLTDETCIHFGY